MTASIPSKTSRTVGSSVWAARHTLQVVDADADALLPSRDSARRTPATTGYVGNDTRTVEHRRRARRVSQR
jgi:hypothetical protein